MPTLLGQLKRESPAQDLQETVGARHLLVGGVVASKAAKPRLFSAQVETLPRSQIVLGSNPEAG
jgi:hypothetical protein